MVEAQHIELGPRCGIENVRESDLNWRTKDRHPRRLNRDVERVLCHPGRQHVLDELSRHGGHADLHVGNGLAIGADCRVRLHGQGEFAALLVRQVRRSLLQRRDGGRRAGGDVLQRARQHPWQINFAAVGVVLLLLQAAHRPHGGVGDARAQAQVHHHLGPEDTRGHVGGRASVDRQLYGAGGHIVEREPPVRIGVGHQIGTQDLHLGVRDRVEEDVVGCVDDAIRPTPDVVEGHRLQVRPRVHHAAHELGAQHRRQAHRRETGGQRPTSLPVAIRVKEGAVGRSTDGRAVHMQRDRAAAGQRFGEKQPGVGAVVGGHDRGGQLGAVSASGIEAVAVERGRVHRPAEDHPGPEGRAHVGAAAGGRQAADAEQRQRIDLHAAAERGGVACGVARAQAQRVVADAQVAQRQRLVEAAAGGVENQRLGCAAVDRVTQLRQRAASGVCRATQAAGGGEAVAIGQAGQAERGRLGVEREAARIARADVARGVAGDDGCGVAAVGRAGEGQRGREAEVPRGVQRQGLQRTGVDADLRTGHAREVIQHLAGEGKVGVAGSD